MFDFIFLSIFIFCKLLFVLYGIGVCLFPVLVPKDKIKARQYQKCTTKNKKTAKLYEMRR